MSSMGPVAVDSYALTFSAVLQMKVSYIRHIYYGAPC